MTNEYSNFTSSFYNASGGAKSDVVLSEMSKLIVNEPKAVVLAIQNAGINLPLESSPASITKTIMIHKGNKRLIQNLSAIILLNERYDDFLKGLGKKIGGIFKKKGDSGGASGGASGGKKGGFFSKIGNFFKRGEKADGTKGTSKFGDWFKGNKESIGDIGSALAGGLLGGGASMGGNQQQGGGYYGSQQGGGNQQQGGGDVKPPMSMGVKIAIGGGVLVLIVGIVLIMRKK